MRSTHRPTRVRRSLARSMAALPLVGIVAVWLGGTLLVLGDDDAVAPGPARVATVSADGLRGFAERVRTSLGPDDFLVAVNGETAGRLQEMARTEGARIAHLRTRTDSIPIAARNLIASYANEVHHIVTIGHGVARWLETA